MAGLFFCLAPAEDAGLLFCPAAIQPHTSVYSGFYPVHAVIQHTPQNGAQGFTGAFPVACPILQPQIPDRHKLLKYRLCRAGAYHSAAAPPAHTRYQRHTRTLYRPAQPPYYNKVYKGAAVRSCYGSMPDGATYRRPCQPGGLRSGTGQRSGRTGSVWSTPPGGAVQRQGQGGRRGTIGGYRRNSFRAFAR